LQAVKERVSRLPNFIIFPAHMGTPAANAPAPTPPQPGWWQQHGNTAQWFAVIVALVTVFGNMALTLWFHYTASEAKASDEHVNALVDGKLNPALTELNRKVDAGSNKLSDLTIETANLRKAVQTLADSQSKETQKIIDRLISTARTASPRTASKLLDTATSLLLVARSERIPADAEYFERTVAELKPLKDSRVFPSVFSVKLALASYRSSLESARSLPFTSLSRRAVMAIIEY